MVRVQQKSSGILNTWSITIKHQTGASQHIEIMNSFPYITNFRSRSDSKNSLNLNLVQQFRCYLLHIMQHKLIYDGRQQQLHCGTLLLMNFYL